MGLIQKLVELLTGSGMASVKDLAEVFRVNAEAASERGDDLQASVLQQFAAEFHDRRSRTWWDSFVDGLNRLPRPLLTLIVPSPLVLTPLYPVDMAEAYAAWALIPPWYGYLIVTVVGFYFVGRNQIKNLDFQRDAAEMMVSMQGFLAQRRELRALDAPEEGAPAFHPDLPQSTNPALQEWRSITQKE